MLLTKAEQVSDDGACAAGLRLKRQRAWGGEAAAPAANRGLGQALVDEARRRGEKRGRACFGDGVDDTPPESTGRPKRGLSDWRQLAVVAYRDPEHVAERFALHNTQRLAEPAVQWARSVRQERPEVPRAVIAEEVRTQSARAAAIEGAVAGSPFLIALVPGYVAYLRQEARMLLRTSALYDRDPRELEATAEMLALRGVHPTIDAARSALLEAQHVPVPPKPTKRRPLRTWVRAGYVLLILGGFLSGSSSKEKQASHPKLKTVFACLVGFTIWVITWVLPVTFMLAMAWGCDTNARRLGQRALIFLESDPDKALAAITAAKQRKEPGHYRRLILLATLLILSVVIPLGFIAWADHQRNSNGITGLSAAGGLIALSLVIGTAVAASRR